MPTARKLPSGSWRCQVFSHYDDNGKRVYKSFTSNDKSKQGRTKAEKMASEWSLDKKSDAREAITSLTLEECFDRYLENRSSVLSPSTIRGYKINIRNHFEKLKPLPLSKITQEMIQKEINEISKKSKPKTVRNIHGILSAVMREYRPGFVLTTRLPQKVKPELYIPTDQEVACLLEITTSKDMRIAIMLAAYGPLRRSEICALTDKDFDGNGVYVKKAKVMNEHGEYKIKTTKTVSSTRYVALPSFVCDELVGIKGNLINVVPQSLTDMFDDLLASSDLPKFRFHDLRHYCASSLHAAGVPDAYIMKRGGWSSDNVLKNIYRHTLADIEKSETYKVNEHFSAIHATRNTTQKNKTLENQGF